MKALHVALIAGAGIGGYLLYRKFFGPQSGSYSVSPYSSPQPGYNGQLSAQPSQMYPVQPIIPPRVDNSSQPWYAGDRSFNLSSPDSMFGSGFSGVVNDFKNVASISDSIASINDSLGISDWFSNGSSAGSSFSADSYGDSSSWWS